MTSNIGPTEHHQFYGNGAGAAEVAVDQCGIANMTAGTDHIYTASFGYGADCTVMVAVQLESGVTPGGYIFARYDGDTLQGIRYNGTTSLQLIVDNSIARTITIPSDGGHVVSWSMATDPTDPTRMRSEVRAFDADTELFSDGISWTHDVVPGLAASDIIWGAQVTAGTNGTGGELRGAGFLLHGAGSVQVHRDRVAELAAPTITGLAPIERTVPPWSSGFGAQDTPAGPTHYATADAVAANRLLTLSPLVNVQWEDAVVVPYAAMTAHPWWSIAPDGESYMGLPWTWLRPVPATVTHVSARAHVEIVSSSGATSFDVTLWSFNRNPGADSEVPLESHSETVTVTSAAAASPGLWLSFDDMRLRLDEDSSTWLTISMVATGAGVAEVAIQVRAVTIDPLVIVDDAAVVEEGDG